MKPAALIRPVLPVALFAVLACSASRAQHDAHNMPGMSGSPATTPAPAMPQQHQSMPGMSPQPIDSPPVIPSKIDGNTSRAPASAGGLKSSPVSDNMITSQFLFDQLEYRRSRDGTSALTWDFQGRVGTDYHRLWIKSEGEREEGRTQDGRLEFLYSRPVAAFWDLQAGIRRDFGEGPKRNWFALGVQGVAPYWFDVEGTFYVGSSGRTALRLNAEYQVVLTQRTFLTPEVQANFYGKSDPARGIGSGLSDVELGIRLRHEIRRELAPYIGVNLKRRLGRTADIARAAGDNVFERQIVAGVRLWY